MNLMNAKSGETGIYFVVCRESYLEESSTLLSTKLFFLFVWPNSNSGIFHDIVETWSPDPFKEH